MPISRRTFVTLPILTGPLAAESQNRSAKDPAVSTRSALVVVDAQVGVLGPLWESQRLIANLERLVTKARTAGSLVVWVQHSDDELKFGSDPWKLAPNFVPAPNEVVIHKKHNSSFARTELDQTLKSRNIERIVLAGAATNWCIRATAYAAVDRGYNLTLVGDAHSTESMRFRDGRVVTAESIVTDLNVVFKWLNAPDVKTEVVDTAAVKL